MGQIQSDVGLVTGIPIGDTVKKLMQIAARPRELLQTQTDTFKSQQTAVTSLSVLLLQIKYITDNLGKDEVYNKQEVSSSDSGVLAAAVTGNPLPGTYQFTPLQTAQIEQLLSSTFHSDTEALGGGKLSFRFGSGVDRSIRLTDLNGGQGIARGTIRITDHSGAHADIDLSYAQTLNDVLAAINSNTTINVTAVAQGDHVRLIDNTGEAAANLKVQEVAGGHTAASLGLASINTPDNTADGQDIVRLGENLDLSALSDGNGVRPSTVLPDIQYTLRDGTTGVVDFSPLLPGGSQVDREETLGDMIQVFNAANPGKLKLEIAPDGDHLIATDLTAPDGQHSFQLQSQYDSLALRDLGLDGTATDGTLVGRRILSGTQTVLLSSLNGGQGFGSLSAVKLTDRSGAFATADLSQAETLEEVVNTLNGSGVGIVAQVNQARNGIQLVDTTGAEVSNMIVEAADGDPTNTAGKLGIAVNDAVTSVNSGDMHLQGISENTRLADVNGGAGVARGTVTIHDSSGQQAVLDLRPTTIQTVGDVIKAINRLPLSIDAGLNDTGDGIRIVDTGHGAGPLKIDEGETTTGHDLHLLGPATSQEIDGQTTQVIDGATTVTVTLDPNDSLSDLRDKINALGAGVRASILSDGSAKPFRLVLTSEQSGKAGELVSDASAANFTLHQTAQARNALLLLGQPGTTSSVVLSSSSNTFADALGGVSLQVKRASGQPVEIDVSRSDTSVVTNVQTMVDDYNKFRSKLAELTAYDATTNKSSVLTGDGTALRLDTELSDLLSGRFVGAGTIHSLAQIGITLNNAGALALDQDKLKAAYADDPAGVKQFFTAKDVGLSARCGQLIQQLAGENTSLLSSRISALSDKIQANQDRIEQMNKHLEDQQNRLYTEFYNMEIAIAKLRANLAALDSIRYIGDLTSTTNSSNTLGSSNS
jgi:flagellar hook-associated protein 2